MEDRIRSGSRIPGRRFGRVAIILGGLVALEFGFAARADSRSKGDDVVAIQAAIDAGNHAYVAALEAHDAPGFADLFVEDAVSLPPFGPLIRGRAAIEASMSAAFARVVFVSAAMHTTETRMMGDTAVELGTYRLITQVDGYPTILTGRYLTVWHRDGNGWKIAIDSSQPDPSPPAHAKE
jgi:uncharacterized protein (TIGR02246 family)